MEDLERRGRNILEKINLSSKKEKLSVLVEHAKLFETLLPHKSFAIMKKHFKSYVSGFDGSKELRMMLMECESASAIEHVISNRKEMKSG